jgi:protein TonB
MSLHKLFTMTSNEILHSDFLDILFDNRNKTYGAYLLRKNYGSRMGWSLAIGISSFLLLLLVIRPSKESAFSIPPPPDVVLKDYRIPPEIKKPEQPLQKPSQPSPPVAQQKFTDQIKIVDHQPLTENLMPVMTNLDQVMPSTITGTGLPFTGGQPSPTSGNGDGKPATSSAGPEPLIQREPEFPGGTKAWLAFLQRHLMVPGDLEDGEKKIVVVRFIVSPEGNLTGFEVLQSAGNIYDQEVIRVLKKMPKWKPAIQNNMPVSRSFTQPVSFVGAGL